MLPVKNDLSVVLGNIIRSLLKPAPKTTLACLASSEALTSLPLSAFPPFEVASDTSAAQMWLGTRQGNHTDWNRNLFCLGVQTNRCWIRPGSYLAKFISTEKVSSGRWRIHTTLQKQTGIFVLRNLWVSRVGATKQPTIMMTISDESHWYDNVPTLASAPSLAQHLVYGKNA